MPGHFVRLFHHGQNSQSHMLMKYCNGTDHPWRSTAKCESDITVGCVKFGTSWHDFMHKLTLAHLPAKISVLDHRRTIYSPIVPVVAHMEPIHDRWTIVIRSAARRLILAAHTLATVAGNGTQANEQSGSHSIHDSLSGRCWQSACQHYEPDTMSINSTEIWIRATSYCNIAYVRSHVSARYRRGEKSVRITIIDEDQLLINKFPLRCRKICGDSAALVNRIIE